MKNKLTIIITSVTVILCCFVTIAVVNINTIEKLKTEKSILHDAVLNGLSSSSNTLDLMLKLKNNTKSQ